MTIEEELVKFLTLEEAVAGLADRLEQLRSETERYDQARGHLDDAARQLDALIAGLTAVTSGVGSVIETLRSIDTAALLAGQEEIANRFAAVESGFAEARAQSGTLQTAFEATGQSVVEAVGAVRAALDSLPAQLTSLEGAFTEKLSALDARSSAAEERLAGLAAANGASIEALGGKLERFESTAGSALEDQRALILSSAAETASEVRSASDAVTIKLDEQKDRVESVHHALTRLEEALTGKLSALDARSSAAEERLAGLAAANGASIGALGGKLERFESTAGSALEDQRALILSSAAETAKNVRSSLESFAATVSEGTNRLEAAEAATRQELQAAIRQLQGRVTIGFGALGALGVATLAAALIR